MKPGITLCDKEVEIIKRLASQLSPTDKRYYDIWYAWVVAKEIRIHDDRLLPPQWEAYDELATCLYTYADEMRDAVVLMKHQFMQDAKHVLIEQCKIASHLNGYMTQYIRDNPELARQWFGDTTQEDNNAD